jgi:Mce-associated membrane protein
MRGSAVSVSQATVDKDIERITASATGDFQDQFTRSAAQVRSAVVQNKVSSQGTVLRTGLVSGDTRHAVVLVAVDATIKNKAAPAGKLSHYRIRVDLTRNHQSGQWLVSQLQFVG